MKQFWRWFLWSKQAEQWCRQSMLLRVCRSTVFQLRGNSNILPLTKQCISNGIDVAFFPHGIDSTWYISKVLIRVWLNKASIMSGSQTPMSYFFDRRPVYGVFSSALRWQLGKRRRLLPLLYEFTRRDIVKESFGPVVGKQDSGACMDKR